MPIAVTIDEAAIKAEVEAAFAAYERALVGNDVEALDRFFLPSEHAIRYGVGENLYGFAEIKAFRAGRSPVSWRKPASSLTGATLQSRRRCFAAIARSRPARSGVRCRPGCAFPRGGGSSRRMSA
jgi:Protein of unknown function (DUF3225)